MYGDYMKDNQEDDRDTEDFFQTLFFSWTH